jgi:hypothetical protein
MSSSKHCRQCLASESEKMAMKRCSGNAARVTDGREKRRRSVETEVKIFVQVVYKCVRTLCADHEHQGRVLGNDGVVASSLMSLEGASRIAPAMEPAKPFDLEKFNSSNGIIK